jgi:hypothetical protein
MGGVFGCGKVAYLEPVGNLAVELGDALDAIVERLHCLGRLEVRLRDG